MFSKDLCPTIPGGLAFAIAKDVDEAKNLVEKKLQEEIPNTKIDEDDWGKIRIHELSEKVAYEVGGSS